MSKKLFILMAVMMLATLILTACGGAAAEDCSSEDVLCIGLVTDVGEVDDKSFNQSAWEGAQEAAAKYGALKVEYIETKDAKDYGPNMQLFLDEGYDIIITVGFAMGEATDIAAGENPDTWFIGVDQWPSGDNVNFTGLVFNEDHSGFLAGALAAMMSESGVLAGVYGTDLIPPVVAFKEGYEAGAAYINPDIQVISTYHPGGMDVAFTDPEWGATTAAQAIDNGADVVFGAGGKTGNGAIIEAAGYDGVYCIGVDSDQWFTVPEAHPCLISSAMKLITPGIVDMIDLWVEGTPPEFVFFGGAGLAPFHDFESVIPADVQSQLDDLAAGLADGSITTGYGQ
ncbi:MAG: BMP family ABC transporter substrate-binding protein [Anaerolineales bacterium]|nr:BMP family ABC transporter substrate-binding protein [Anaerolineales bacterium]